MKSIHGLLSSARSLLDENFRSGEVKRIDASAHIVERALSRDIDIEPLISVLRVAMERYEHDRDQSDAWLAPRVHATLRLTRREAADRQIWSWLNVIGAPDYVRWRWSGRESEEGKIVPIDRFMGKDSKNSLGRLWWSAELTRNGADYSETVSVLRHSRFIDRWLDLNAMHHRAAAIAVCRFHRSFNGDKGVTNPQSVILAKAFNIRIATLSLDALAPSPAIDTFAMSEWCKAPIDETAFVDALPIGPDEDPVAEEHIAGVIDVLSKLADEVRLKDLRPTKKNTDETSSTTLEATRPLALA